jgi:hypothetical protein
VNRSWTITASLEHGAAASPALEVRFRWQRDRYHHQVVLLNEFGETPLIQSMEGDDQQDFPPSPPLQDMSVEARPTGAVALAVGMAGAALWSVSVQATPGRGLLEFDWACQTRGARIWPQNCYRWLDPEFPDNSAAAGAVSQRDADLAGGLAADGRPMAPAVGPANDQGSRDWTLHRWHSPVYGPRQVVLRLTGPSDLLLVRYGDASQEAPSAANAGGDVNGSAPDAVLQVRQTPRADQVAVPAGLRWQYDLQIE